MLHIVLGDSEELFLVSNDSILRNFSAFEKRIGVLLVTDWVINKRSLRTIDSDWFHSFAEKNAENSQIDS